jgi:hypothetical protein
MFALHYLGSSLHYLGSSFAPLLSQISHFVSLCVACNACSDGHLRWRSHLGTSRRDHHFTRFVFYSSALRHLSHRVLMRCMQCMLGRRRTVISGGGAILALLVAIIILLNSMALPCRSANFPTSGAAFNVHIHSLWSSTPALTPALSVILSKLYHARLRRWTRW